MSKSNQFDIASFCAEMEKDLGDQEGPAKVFWRALSFAVSAHQDQKRKSGEAYVSHPLMVAQILKEELGIRDPEVLAAAVLHDTVEDVPDVTPELIGELFGRNIEAIVDGCTKISHFDGERQTFYKLVHRKIFSGAASRLEIMLIKMADRLHNLRTIGAMPRHKRQKIAEETLDVYAPMAAVMGLYGLKRELYDLALINKFPRQSSKVLAAIRQLETDPEPLIIRKQLQAAAEEVWLSCQVDIRAKGLWAYFDPAHKVLAKEIDYPLEFIIAVEDIQSCYRGLGVLNQTFPPIPRTIRDFIANPKPTGYQSLHARANIRGRNYLFKIRTQQMIEAARCGILSEWSARRQAPDGFERELREMFDILGGELGLSYRDMIAASGKKEIYTYTPKGDRICLPVQSTVLDFAFRVHTEVGIHCAAAIVGRNKEKVAPTHVLRDGDQVQIVIQKEPVRFEPRVQDLCQTPKARSALARIFRLRRERLAREIGRAVMRQELKRYGVPFEVLEKPELADILVYFGLQDREELFQHVGEGKLRLKEIIYEIRSGLYADRQTLQPPTGPLNRIDLDSLDPVCIKLSRCCNPSPTEKGLFGLLSERGLSVHRHDCETFRTLHLAREDVVELRWRPKETAITKPQTLVILGTTRNRVLMMLGAAPSEMRVSEIIRLSRDDGRADWEVNFQVEDVAGLRRILQHFDKTGFAYEFILEQ
ncbi:MAG: HD domain-containing protein [Desulfobacteraceae bacterium]|nr:HD domain-containing protein [Desulfobacteraceae bacterium]